MAIDSSFDSPLLPPFPVHRFSVSEYRQLGSNGLLQSEDVELLEGWITPKMNHSPAHSVTVKLLESALNQLLPPEWFTRTQDSVATADSEPEPDIAVVRGQIRDYLANHPTAEDCALVVEVAETSLVRDRYKRQIYGAAGYPVYWIVNLSDRIVEVYYEPFINTVSDRGYRQRVDYTEDESVVLQLAGSTAGTIKVRNLLP